MNTPKITLTRENIEKCESVNHAYTFDTITALGGVFHNCHPLAGWKEALIGKTISLERYQAALDGRSKKAHKIENAKAQLPLL